MEEFAFGIDILCIRGLTCIKVSDGVNASYGFEGLLGIVALGVGDSLVSFQFFKIYGWFPF